MIAVAAGTTCYDCTTVVGEACGDEWVANSDYELDCSGTGDSSDEDGSCYKDKNKTKLFGVWVTTGKDSHLIKYTSDFTCGIINP